MPVRAEPSPEAITPRAGAVITGAVSVLLVSVSVPASVASVPLTTGSVMDTFAPCMIVVLKAPVVAKLPASASVPVVTVSPVPAKLTTTALPGLPVSVGSLSKASSIAENCPRIGADAPNDPVAGTPSDV